MKNTFLIFFAFVVLLSAGCTQSVRYTEEEIQKFPVEVQDHIRKGEINVGMNKEQVRYAWGSPDSIEILDPFEGNSREEWTYSQKGTFGVVSSRLLLFYDNKLIYIKY
jgi:outer membrane protein assembly factor BamE (lipoprotein component of BamABCDE complex)